MPPRPSRANARISSRPSQGFISRLRRSTFCAFVSFTASGILSPVKLKTHSPFVSVSGSEILNEACNQFGSKNPLAETCCRIQLQQQQQVQHMFTDWQARFIVPFIAI